jgi:hypothetical protein
MICSGKSNLFIALEQVDGGIPHLSQICQSLLCTVEVAGCTLPRHFRQTDVRRFGTSIVGRLRVQQPRPLSSMSELLG